MKKLKKWQLNRRCIVCKQKFIPSRHNHIICSVDCARLRASKQKKAFEQTDKGKIIRARYAAKYQYKKKDTQWLRKYLRVLLIRAAVVDEIIQERCKK